MFLAVDFGPPPNANQEEQAEVQAEEPVEEKEAGDPVADEEDKKE